MWLTLLAIALAICGQLASGVSCLIALRQHLAKVVATMQRSASPVRWHTNLTSLTLFSAVQARCDSAKRIATNAALPCHSAHSFPWQCCSASHQLCLAQCDAAHQENARPQNARNTACVTATVTVGWRHRQLQMGRQTASQAQEGRCAWGHDGSCASCQMAR